MPLMISADRAIELCVTEFCNCGHAREADVNAHEAACTYLALWCEAVESEAELPLH